MHKHYSNGPETVRRAKWEHEYRGRLERITTVMVWMTYGWVVLTGIILLAAGWM